MKIPFFSSKEERWVLLFAVTFFTIMVSMMVAYATGYGNSSVNGRGVVMSGFDCFIYHTVKQWHICYATMRHPLLSPLLWPLAIIKGWWQSLFGVDIKECLVGILWVLTDTASFMLLFRTLRRHQRLRLYDSILLTVFFFSIAYVLLAAIFPDHMALTVFCLSLTLYLSARAIRTGRPLSLLQSIGLFIVSAGITTTNGIKIFLADAITHLSSLRSKAFRLRSAAFRFRSVAFRLRLRSAAFRLLLYSLAALLLFGAHYAQDEYIVKPAIANRQKAQKEKMKKNPQYAQKIKARWNKNSSSKSKQVAKGKVFEFTDISIPRIPSLTENVFGEGLQLHSEHLLEDPQGLSRKVRPLFVSYTSLWLYAVEAVLVLLLIIGIFLGIRDRLLWVPLSWFLFDMLIHVGLCFAIHDVYIMTAHWALIFPIALSYIIKRSERSPRLHLAVTTLLTLLTLHLLYHNISLIATYCL